MTTVAQRIETRRAHRLARAAVRLRLKRSHRSCGFVQGAWWPRSTRLAGDLPALLNALTPRFGVIDRVHYHRDGWLQTPSNITHRGGDVALDPVSEQPNVITMLGQQFGRLALLVVPPYTDTNDAYAAMTAAASADDGSTPDQLLGLHKRGAKAQFRAKGSRRGGRHTAAAGI